MPEPKTPPTPAPSAVIPESQLLAWAGEIVTAQRKAGLTPNWGNKQHIGLLRRVVETLIANKADALSICRSLDQHGLGGNASAFRQWLSKQDGPTKDAFPKDGGAESYA